MIKTKPTFDNAPQEVLTRIFNELDKADLFACQKVCHSWYSTAHRLFMKNVHLSNNSSIESLLQAIDSNSLYAQSVKQLELGGEENTEDFIDAEHAKQLFTRVPGIKELYILDKDTFNTLFSDKELCETIIEAYPKLEKLYFGSWISYSKTHFAYLKNSLKHSLTYMHDLPWEDPVQFLSSCSNLQILKVSYSFSDFQALLPLFEQQFSLKSLECPLILSDEDNFVDKYMESKTQEERNFMIEKLSKLKTLRVEKDSCFSPNSIRFIKQYFTGITKLKYTIDIEPHWSSPKRDLFCHDFMDYATSLENCEISVLGMKKYHMSASIPVVLSKVFQQLPAGFQCGGKTLQLQMDDTDYRIPRHGFTVTSAKTSGFQCDRFIEIRIGNNTEYIDSIEKGLASNEITSFNYCFNGSCPTSKYIKIFQSTLDHLPLVKKVSLQLPRKVDYISNGKNFPQVINLEICGRRLTQKLGLFADCLLMFPGIRYLKLHCYSGTWNVHLNRFHVSLQNCQLERLYLDASVAISKTRDKLQMKYFVLDVNTANDRYLYHVTVDYLRITKIETHEIDDTPYIHVLIIVKNLEFINLYSFDHVNNKSRISL